LTGFSFQSMIKAGRSLQLHSQDVHHPAIVLSGVPLQAVSLSFAANGHQEPQLGQMEESAGQFRRLLPAHNATAPPQRSSHGVSELRVLRHLWYVRRFALGGHTRGGWLKKDVRETKWRDAA